MDKRGKASGAIGFAIYLDLLEDYDTSGSDFDVDVLLLYDKTDAPGDIVHALQELVSRGYTVQTQRKVPAKLRFRRLMRLEDGQAKEVAE